MRLIGDTNLFIEGWRGNSRAIRSLAEHTEIGVPFIVVAELEIGARLARWRNVEHTCVFALLDTYVVLWPSFQTCSIFAKISTALRVAGTPIGVDDVRVAALSIQHGFPVATNDADLRRVTGLKVIDWG